MELLAVSTLSSKLDSSFRLVLATRLTPSSDAPYRLPTINDNQMFAGNNDSSVRALKRACFLTQFLMADRMDLIKIYYKHFGRVLVMGTQTFVKDVREYKKYITPEYDNMKTGLGAIRLAPVTTIASKDAECNFDANGIDHGFRVQCLIV